MASDADAELAMRNRLQMAAAATRAVVSRADARSRMSRASSRSYLRMPVRSAWPGRTRVTARLRADAGRRRRGAGSMISCQFFQSRLWISIAIGDPMRLARANAGQELDGVLLDLHAAPAAIALLAPRELGVDVVGEQRQARRHSFQNAHERLPVRFTGGRETEDACREA